MRVEEYIMLTFFINEHLVEWNNFASKQASSLYMFFLCEPFGGGFPPPKGSLRLRTAYAGKVIPPTRHAKPGMASEFRHTTFWQPAGRHVYAPKRRLARARSDPESFRTYPCRDSGWPACISGPGGNIVSV